MRPSPRPQTRPQARPRRGALSASTGLLVALAVGGGALLLRTALIPSPAPRADAPTSQEAPSVREALGRFAVRDARGRTVPLVPDGEPAVVMISSRTCGWCKRALRDLGEMAGGRPLPRLRLLTLEGAAEGAPMVAKEAIAGAVLLGPAGSADQVQLTFRYPGTPTFLAVDRRGRVVRTLPGYPIREEMRHWFAVMVGDQDTP
jgi:hypothetical protein